MDQHNGGLSLYFAESSPEDSASGMKYFAFSYFFYLNKIFIKITLIKTTRKRIKKINASYVLEGTRVLNNVEKIKYLGITITNDLKWNTHVSNICMKTDRTLGFRRHKLAACPRDVKESAYKGLVRPVLEYGSSVWDPQSILLQDELEKVQKRAARFVTGNYTYETGSMTGIL